MILRNNLFKIKNQAITETKADFRIRFDSDNFVYKAHFPNNPITPGVLLIQIVAELLSFLKEKNFKIQSLINVKFTAPINPIIFPEVDFSLDLSKRENAYYVKAIVKEKETVFAKISMVLE